MRGKRKNRDFEALMREHAGIVFKIAGAYAHASHERDDLAQEIHLQLWRSFASFDRHRAKFSTWMYRVALNVAISHARASRRDNRDRLESLAEVHATTVAGDDASHDEALQRDQRLAALHAFIDGLDALNRALVLLYLEDRSYAEIAAVLGISETNVATRLNRIKQKMRADAGVAETEGVKNGTR